MSKEDRSFLGRSVLTVVLVLIVVFCLSQILTTDDAARMTSICDAKTADMGMPHRYVLRSGCQVSPEKDVWIPLENYRYQANP